MGESEGGDGLAAPAAAAIETAYASEFNPRRAVFRPGQARKQPAGVACVVRALAQHAQTNKRRATGV
jgi:hypothetical protein